MLMGCANPEGATGFNIARQIALRAGCPVTTSGMTVNRYCSSGLQTIALAAQRIMAGEGEVYVAGGVESISCVQNEHMNTFMAKEAWLDEEQARDLLDHAADRGNRREPLQDSARGAGSLRRAEPAARGGGAGRGPFHRRDRSHRRGRGRRRSRQRPPHDAQSHGERGRRHPGRHQLRGGVEDPAGDARRRDRGRQCQPVLRWRVRLRRDERRARGEAGLAPLGIFRGFAVAGCEPDEMGIGPVFAIPKLLERAGKSIADIDLWELNEAFAVQVLYCARQARHSQRPAQRERRRDRRRAPVRHDGRAAGGSRVDRRQGGAVRSSPWSPCASAAAWVPPACSKSSEGVAVLKNVIALIIAVAAGAIGYSYWTSKDAEESPLNVMVTQMRTRAIIEHERNVTVWYKACPEVKGINPQVMVIWPAKLNYELDLAETRMSLSPDGVLHVTTPPIRADDPSVPSEVGEYMAQTSFWTLDSEQAIVMREMQKATPLARHLTAYFLRNDAGLSEHFKEELETYLRGIAGALGVVVTTDRDRDSGSRVSDPAAARTHAV